jgi:3-dehydroquinate synthase
MFISANDFSKLNELIEPLVNPNSSVIILTDSNVSSAWLANVIASCDSLKKAEVIELEPGEEAKSIEIAGNIYSELLERHCDRHTLMINLGGGVITDLGGFVASTYKRGIDFINIPTSLMAMVDAAIGGKTGIDHQNIKNAVGTFADPVTTILFPDFIQTLPKQELLSGFAEMLKYGIIADKNLWNGLAALESVTASTVMPYIEKCAHIKSEIVLNDPFEEGNRKILNLGHTFGHALESYFLDESIAASHGHCVALGILIETELAQKKNLIEAGDAQNIKSTVARFFKVTEKQLPPIDKLMERLKNDKKNKGGNLLFVLPTAIGKAVIDVAVSEEEAEVAYNEFRKSVLTR